MNSAALHRFQSDVQLMSYVGLSRCSRGIGRSMAAAVELIRTLLGYCHSKILLLRRIVQLSVALTVWRTTIALMEH